MPALSSFVLEIDLSDRSTKFLDVDTFTIEEANTNKIYWIHCDLSRPDEIKKFKKKLQLSRSVVKSCLDRDRISKMIETENFLTLELRCLLFAGRKNERSTNLLVHLTSRYCFTAAYRPLPVIKNLLDHMPNFVLYAETPCFVLFILLDSICALYLDFLDELELEAESMDLKVHEIRYSDVANAKNHVMIVKRHSVALMNILMHTSARKIQVISEPCRVSLVNLLNNAQMVVNEADSIRELLNGTLGRIDNALMQHVNGSMKVLTAVATVFLPPTLIAGIYGMNFQWMPELHWRYGYYMSLGLMLVTGASLYYIFKKMKWF